MSPRPSVGGRGFARPKNRRNAEKAEMFEDALARVSKRVDVVARQAAKDLKAERLAAARRKPAGPAAPASGPGSRPTSSRARSHAKTTGGVKRDASSQSQGARRQAKRDSR
jgi:hypothetical protein